MSRSVSTKSSTRASQSKSKSTSEPAVAAPETTSSPVAQTPSTAPPSALSVLAAEVIQSIDKLEASLGLNIVVRPNDASQMHAMNRVSLAALGVASDIVTAQPTRFPDFSGLPASASYVEAMTPLAARVSEFASHLQNSILNQQAPAAQQTLVLYSVVKGLARMDTNQTMRDKIGQLKAEIVPKRKDPKPKVTKTEAAAKLNSKRLAVRLANARAFIAANDPTASSSSSATASTEASPVVTPALKAVAAAPPATPANGASAPITPAAS